MGKTRKDLDDEVGDWAERGDQARSRLGLDALHDRGEENPPLPPEPPDPEIDTVSYRAQPVPEAEEPRPKPRRKPRRKATRRGKATASVQFSMRVSPTWKARLEDYAELRGLNASELVRVALSAYLDTMERGESFR